LLNDNCYLSCEHAARVHSSYAFSRT
jgi:hypothetical protein